MKKYLITILKTLGFICVFAFFEFIVQFIYYFIGSALTNEYLISILQILLEVGAVVLAVKIFLGKGSFRDVGLSRNFKWKKVLALGGLGILFNSIINLIILALKGYSFQNFMWSKFYAEDILGYMVIGLIAAVASGITDELPIRGYIYNSFRKHNKYLAFVIAAFVYLIIHAGYKGFYIPYITGLILFSVLLTLIYELTGNIIYNITFYAGWFFSSSYIFAIAQGNTPSPGIMLLSMTDKQLLNGGGYGIYGSIVFNIAILAIDIYLFYIMWKRDNEEKIENTALEETQK